MVHPKLHPTIIAAAIHGLNQNDADQLADQIILLSRRLGINEFSDLLTAEEAEAIDRENTEKAQAKAKIELKRYGIVPATVKFDGTPQPWVFVSVKGKQRLNNHLKRLIELFDEHAYVDDYKNRPSREVYRPSDGEEL